jgi:uncharacterized protein (TIGR02646 family)
VRTIRKRNPPDSLTMWRAPRMAADRPPGTDCTYDELRRVPDVVADLEAILLAEQGGLCAYTGRRVAKGSFHCEHPVPQQHCRYGEDAEHRNIVACWPQPNCGFEPKYGARRKGSWPSREQERLFVSPLRPDCTARFSFNQLGEVAATNEHDAPVKETIKRLALGDDELTELRSSAIRGFLAPAGRWRTLTQCHRLADQLDRISASVDNGGSDSLTPYCFAIRQAVALRLAQLGG